MTRLMNRPSKWNVEETVALLVIGIGLAIVAFVVMLLKAPLIY